MPYRIEPSVAYYNGCYYFRTWFLEECEESQLFGITESNLSQVTGVHDPFHVGTCIYLDDAPYFNKIDKTHHRVCGPYEIISADDLPLEATPIYANDGKTLIFLEAHPGMGPWRNQRKKRVIDGVSISFQQIADEFGFFPLRFRIRKKKKYYTRLIPHKPTDCFLC